MDVQAVPEDDVAAPDTAYDFLHGALGEELLGGGDGGDFEGGETVEAGCWIVGCGDRRGRTRATSVEGVVLVTIKEGSCLGGFMTARNRGCSGAALGRLGGLELVEEVVEGFAFRKMRNEAPGYYFAGVASALVKTAVVGFEVSVVPFQCSGVC